MLSNGREIGVQPCRIGREQDSFERAASNRSGRRTLRRDLFGAFRFTERLEVAPRVARSCLELLEVAASRNADVLHEILRVLGVAGASVCRSEQGRHVRPDQPFE